MRMADWVAGFPWYQFWRSSLQKANGHLTTWKRELFQKFMSPKSFCSWFFRHPRAKPINRNQTTTTWILNPFFWQLEESHEVPWKNTTKSVLEPMGRPWSQGFYSLYMILYVFIFYLLLSSHMHAVWRTLSEKNPFSNSLEINLFCDFFSEKTTPVDGGLNKNWSRHLSQPNQHSNTKTASNFRRIYNFSPVSTRYWRTKTNGHKKEVSKKMPC